MPRTPRGLAWVLAAILAAGACARGDVAPMGAGDRPYTPDPDERALVARAEREQEALLGRIRTHDDRALARYLGAVVARLHPAGAAGAPAPTVTVVRDPTLSAFALPTGRIFLHTGLLAALENEAQLATILAREITHVTHRHALRSEREARGTRALSRMAEMAANLGLAVAAETAPGGAASAVLSETANAILGLRLPLATVAAVQGHGRDLEREADREGIERLVKAGYAAGEARTAFERLLAARRERGPVEVFFLGSQARLRERVDSAKAIVAGKFAAAAAGPGRVTDTADFRERVRVAVRDNAHEDLRLGRFELARAQLARVLAAAPDDPVAHLYDGDLRRLQAQRARSAGERASLLRDALERYTRAARLDPDFADPYRQLGLLHYQERDRERARAAFERYVALRPDAPDVPRIREYLAELGR